MRNPSTSALALILCGIATTASPADEARFQFCWIGANGFTMEGIIGFPAEYLDTGIITEAQVSEFRIWGYHEGLPIGSWSLTERIYETTWTLFFDTDKLEFPMGGHFLQQSYQAWNANGEVNDCGVPGFGFNGGNWAQDVCIDNVWIEASSVDPDTPLIVQGMDAALICESVVATS